MSLPGYSSTLNLKPHVTVIAHTSLIYCKAKQVSVFYAFILLPMQQKTFFLD